MQTLKLRVSDNVYEKLIWLLDKFGKDEVVVIPETIDFENNQKYLSAELDEIFEGKAKFIEIDEAEQRIENIIRKNENSI